MVSRWAHNPEIAGSIPASRYQYGAMVKWSKTSPFHGGNGGSNPPGVTIKLYKEWNFYDKQSKIIDFIWRSPDFI